MQGVESLFNAKTSLQIVQMLSSIRSITLEGLPLETGLKSRVQVVQNTPKDSQAQNQENQTTKENAKQDATKNQTRQTKNANTSEQGSTTKSANAQSKTANLSAKSYNVLLQLSDGRKVSVNLPKPLPVGTKLELTTTGKNTGVLQPINAKVNSGIVAEKNLGLTQSQLQNILNSNLSRALPKQMPLQEVLTQLQKLLPKLDAQNQISDKQIIKQSLQEIIRHFPQTKDRTPNKQEIKQAIHNNGVLFEAKMANLANATSNSNINIDLKFLLQRASLLLQNALNSSNTTKADAKQTNAENSANTNKAQNFATAKNADAKSTQSTRANSNTANTTSSRAANSPNLAQSTTGAKANAGNTANTTNLAQTGQASTPQANQANANAQTQGQNQMQNQASQQNVGQAGQNTNSETGPKNEVVQQLSKLLDSAMAKVQTQQHTSLQQSQGTDGRNNVQNLQVSIPFFANGSWQNVDLQLNKIDIDKDGTSEKPNEQKSKIWQVTLNFDLHNWGKMATRLVLRGENLRADLWLENAEHFEKMQLAKESLAARLRGIGAEVESVNCHLGAIAEPKTKTNGDRLIDTKV